MLKIATAFVLFCCGSVASASDWEKFYKPLPVFLHLERSNAPPELVSMQGDMGAQTDEMWQNGYAALGYTYFNSPNANTRDAVKLGIKLGARFVVLSTNLKASTTTDVPITTPTTTTAYTNGTASAYGTGGSATGSYQGTTTTYGSRTTFVPITVNRYDKAAVFFAAVPHQGLGILSRALTNEEVARLETQRAIAVTSVRRGSPAYAANILPGDLILRLNGEPADLDTLKTELARSPNVSVHLLRNGTERDIPVVVPEEWRIRQ